jgi:Fe-S cluster assembly protein SufD
MHVMAATPQSLLGGPISDPKFPTWWQKGREAAWEKFKAFPMPSRRDEDWRFANVNHLQIDSFHLPASLDPKIKTQIIDWSKLTEFEAMGEVIFGNDQLAHFKSVPAELTAKGVIWEPIEQALVNHSDLLQKYFMTKLITMGSAKFEALHRSYCKAGMLLFVPKGVEIELPLKAFYWMDGEGVSSFPHTLIVAEAQSKVTVVDIFASTEETSGFACSVNDLYVGPGAQVSYVAAQYWSEKTLNFQLNSTQVDRDASAQTFFVNLGGNFSRLENKSSIIGTGGRSEMLSISVGDEKQEFDQRTLQQHMAPNTWSDLLYKNSLNFHSKSIFKGLIRVEPGASQTDAYQTNRNLLLSPDAESSSMPGLEILNDDVKCSHGATTGQMDDEQLFYLLSRGITLEMAKRLLSLGFFEEVLHRVSCKPVAEAMRKLIEEKFLLSKEATSLIQQENETDETDVRQLQGTK